jgi:gamma-glutamyltranspeptidase/glutathione hydrolase/leukotriene-C4 hydrolase
VDNDNTAVAITTTVNLSFGSRLLTSTGIILNNQIDDFSFHNFSNAFGLPPTPANFLGMMFHSIFFSSFSFSMIAKSPNRIFR